MNKGFLEEVRVAQAALEANPATASTELRERRHSLQAQLVHVAQSNLESAQRDAECRALQSELSQLEATLAERVALIAQIVLDQKITLSDIAANLPRICAGGLHSVSSRRSYRTKQQMERGQIRCLSDFPTGKRFYQHCSQTSGLGRCRAHQ